MKKSRDKFFSFLMYGGVLLICYLIGKNILHYYYIYYHHVSKVNPVIDNIFETYVFDSLLGLKLKPQNGVVSILPANATASWSFRIDNDIDGYRRTSENPEAFQGKPQIWFFGCSFTWGWPVNNWETLPWLIQEEFNNYRVRNFAMPGFSNTHALLQFKDMVTKEKPKVAILSYSNFHQERNIAAANWLNTLVNVGGAENNLFYPKAFFLKGQLQIENIAIKEHDLIEHGNKYMSEITKAIFKEIVKVAKDNNIIPVLAVQTGSMNNEIVKYCKKIGFLIADIIVHHENKGYNCNPFDQHPNSKAHELYARKLIPVLNRILNE